MGVVIKSRKQKTNINTPGRQKLSINHSEFKRFIFILPKHNAMMLTYIIVRVRVKLIAKVDNCQNDKFRIYIAALYGARITQCNGI